MQPLPTYQTFAVNLGEIASLMNYIEVDKQTRLKKTGLGDNKVRGLLDYLKDFGIANKSKSSLTELGDIFKTQDKKLSDDFTKWLCLYNWAKIDSNPAIHFLLNFARNGYTTKNIVDSFKEWASDNNIKTEYQNDYAGNLIRISCNSLLESEAFQDLSLITIQQDEMYRVQPYNVHTLLIGYVLYDNSKGRRSVSIPQLMDEPGNVGRFFGYGEQALNKHLDDLANIGLVQRVQNANLNMVQLSYDGHPLDFVKRYYAEN